MPRRQILGAGLALGASVLLSPFAWAEPQKGLGRGAVSEAARPRIDVVKIVSFGCPLSRASESLDKPIEELVAERGGKFVFSPFPTEADPGEASTSGARERVYYASRKFGVHVESDVRAALFRGVQDMSLGLTDYLQTYTWLMQSAEQHKQYFADIFKQAQEKAAGESLGKAAFLAHSAGSASLPSYILLVDGEVKTAIGPEDVPGGTLPKLRDAVLAAILQHSQPN